MWMARCSSSCVDLRRAYCTPRSEWCTSSGLGRRRASAIRNAAALERCRHPRPAVTGKLQREVLQHVAKFQVRIRRPGADQILFLSKERTTVEAVPRLSSSMRSQRPMPRHRCVPGIVGFGFSGDPTVPFRLQQWQPRPALSERTPGRAINAAVRAGVTGDDGHGWVLDSFDRFSTRAVPGFPTTPYHLDALF